MCKKWRPDTPVSFGIDASSQCSVTTDLEHFHSKMCPDQVADGRTLPNLEKLVRLMDDWFSGRKERFLSVYDGTGNTEDPKHPFYVDLNVVVFHFKSVYVIVTTRISPVAGFGLLSVGVFQMEEDEAFQLFINSSGSDQWRLRTNEMEEIKAIVKIQLAGSHVS